MYGKIKIKNLGVSTKACLESTLDYWEKYGTNQSDAIIKLKNKKNKNRKPRSQHLG
jgi:hypothetical protein